MIRRQCSSASISRGRHLHHVDHHHVGVPDRGDHFVLGLKLELVGDEVHAAVGHLLGFPVQIRLDVVGHYDLRSIAHRCSLVGPLSLWVRVRVQGFASTYVFSSTSLPVFADW